MKFPITQKGTNVPKHILFRYIGKGCIKIEKGGILIMERNMFTYEAIDSALVIHLPKEVDHHNCLTLKYETDLLHGRKIILTGLFLIFRDGIYG